MKGMYDAGLEMFLAGTHGWTTTVRGLLVDDTYVFDASGDQDLADISAGVRLDTAVAIANPTVAAGVADCDPVTFSAVAGGDTIGGVIFYYHTGTESTSTLIYYDGEDGGGIPFAEPTNGTDVTYTPNASGVFAL